MVWSDQLDGSDQDHIKRDQEQGKAGGEGEHCVVKEQGAVTHAGTRALVTVGEGVASKVITWRLEIKDHQFKDQRSPF